MKEAIYICRHGKTKWNLEKRKQGHLDSPLCDQGKKQAHLLADIFKDVNGLLYSSDLG